MSIYLNLIVSHKIQVLEMKGEMGYLSLTGTGVLVLKVCYCYAIVLIFA